MATSWNLTRLQIATKVLQKLGTLARGETPDPDDSELVYDQLDMLLKELPIHGYSWPKTVSGQATLLLLAATQATALPADYFPGTAMVSYLDSSSNEVPLDLVTLEQWNKIPRKSEPGDYPRFGYIDNFNVLHTYPVQTAQRTAKLVYQQIADDTTAVGGVDLSQIWLKGLIYGLAAALGDEFGASSDQIIRWEVKWIEARDLCIARDTFPAPPCMSVDDGPRYNTAGGWPLWTSY